MAKSPGMAPPLIAAQATRNPACDPSPPRRRTDSTAANSLIPTAQLAHEIKSPLSVILYRAHMLAESAGSLSATQQRYVTQIIQASEEMQRTIENMQDLALGEAGALVLERDEVVPAALIAVAAAQLAPLAEKKHQQVSISSADNLPNVTADRARLQQILVNLLANAIKFTREGGTIVIGAQRGPGNAIDFYVRDNGPGIAKKHQAAIFQPFFRAHATRTPGTGLGLSLAEQLTHLHHGAIWVESQWHKGSTFWVRIPGETTAPCR